MRFTHWQVSAIYYLIYLLNSGSAPPARVPSRVRHESIGAAARSLHLHSGNMARQRTITTGQALRSRLGVALWIGPAFSVIGAIILAVVARIADESLGDGRHHLPALLDRGDAEDLRTLVGAVAGASISTLALVLSLTMVVISIASTQFGPRLVRTFLRSRATKATISSFTGLFVFSLLVLDSTSGVTSEGKEFVPSIGGSLVLVGAIAAVGCLVWYVQDVASSIQLPSVVASVVSDLHKAVDEIAGDSVSSGGHERIDTMVQDWVAKRSDIADDAAELLAGTSGYVQLIEREPLIRVAAQANAIVEMLVRPGDFVVAGEAIARVSPAGALDQLAPVCAHRIDVGRHRTLDQDLQMAVDQVVEVALRALSPAINDTFTGLTCLDWLADALVTLARTPLHRTMFGDKAGNIRLVERPHSFAGIVHSAYEKIRQSGAENPAVTIRLMESIARVSKSVQDPDGRAALAEEADACYFVSAPTHALYDRVDLTERYLAVCEILGVTPVTPADGIQPTADMEMQLRSTQRHQH